MRISIRMIVGLVLLLCQIAVINYDYFDTSTRRIISLEIASSPGGIAEIIGFCLLGIIGIIFAVIDIKKSLVTKAKPSSIKIEKRKIVIFFAIITIIIFVLFSAFTYSNYKNIKTTENIIAQMKDVKSCMIEVKYETAFVYVKLYTDSKISKFNENTDDIIKTVLDRKIHHVKYVEIIVK